MNASWIVTYWLDLQKAAFDNGYGAMTMAQDHGEKLVQTLFEQAAWFPEESKRLLDQWVDMAKKGRDDFKSAVDDHFNQLGSFFPG